MPRHFPRRSRSFVPGEPDAVAAGLYVALVREGSLGLAREFARWWLDRRGFEVSAEGAPIELVDVDQPYTLDELGIDQEDFEWP